MVEVGTCIVLAMRQNVLGLDGGHFQVEAVARAGPTYHLVRGLHRLRTAGPNSEVIW